MKWATPQAWLLLIPLALILVLVLLRREKRRGTLKYSTTHFAAAVPKGLRAKMAFFPTFLKILAAVFMIIALARPQESNTKVNRNVEGIDIMIALDVSDSMLIEDMEPENRITAAKLVIKRFVKGRGSDRVGLIVFAGESYTRVPLTLDYDVLLGSLDSVSTDNIKQGTAIGVALANAVARLKDSTARSRVIILLTDGESNSGTIDPETALDIAKGYGIRVYTIGAGRDGQAQIPVYTKDPFGNRVKHYQPLHSSVNNELLQKIADETGGKFYRAEDTDTLRKVFSSIGILEKTKIEVNQYVKYTEKFEFWLFWAFVFYLAQFVLSRTLLWRAP